LDAAGFRLRQRDASSVPHRLSFTCLVFADDARFQRLALLVQKQLADVGVEMKLVPLLQKDLEPRLVSGDFDSFLFEMYGRSVTWTYIFWHSQHGSPLMDTGFHSADPVLDRLRASRSDEEARSAVADLAAVMHDDPPAAFLAWQTTTRAVSNRFDVRSENDRDIFANVWQWRPAGAGEQADR
jgi:ABC-type transport system substrate-binding protein